jgi:hypothetical protein
MSANMLHPDKGLIYLASPYSHPDPRVEEARFEAVCMAAGRLMAQGHHIFSPIAHSHPIAKRHKLPTDWEYWKKYDEAILRTCAHFWVYSRDGWRESTGVAAETAIARRLGLPEPFLHIAPTPVERTVVETALAEAV